VKVVIISQYYPPENTLISPTLARKLADKGHQVRVITGFPNYPEGRLFDGYTQRLRGRERDGQVDVLRVPLWVDHSQNAARRVLNYSSFALSAATAYGFARGADVIYVYATQMTPALAPWLWRLWKGAPYVLHVQDLWPDSITGSSLVKGGRGTKIVDSLLTPWLTSVYRHAAGVIGIAPTMVRTLIQRGVNPQKAHLIYNWALEDSLPWSHVSEGYLPSRADATRILYGGNIGDMQDLETAVRAAHQARDAGIHLTIVGDGIALSRVRALVAELGGTNIDFKGRVPRAQMHEFYRVADYALIALKDLPTFQGTIPSKFQAALSHGVPVITTVQGDVRDLVEDLSVGYTADAEDVNSLEAAFRAAAASTSNGRAQMAARARGAYLDHFSLDAGIAAVEQILIDAARSRAQRAPQTTTKGTAHAAS
jgi:glycosyltransferase involved in cell wall biosynthesis